MDYTAVAAFVRSWLEAWNAHDVEAVLAHFTEDATFTSPVAARILEGSDGVIHGKAALREIQGPSSGRLRRIARQRR